MKEFVDGLKWGLGVGVALLITFGVWFLGMCIWLNMAG